MSFFFSFIKRASCAVYFLVALSVQYFWVGRCKLLHCVCTAPSTSIPVLSRVNRMEAELIISTLLLSSVLIHHRQLCNTRPVPKPPLNSYPTCLHLHGTKTTALLPITDFRLTVKVSKLHCKMQDSSRASSVMTQEKIVKFPLDSTKRVTALTVNKRKEPHSSCQSEPGETDTWSQIWCQV